tara:strand:+ start:1227 stop:1844 length:618 start_codon:yes stop_codon:yes gene_type:complete
MNNINMLILYVGLSYLIGSISGSLILGKLWKIDIRTLGSGNAGGTNALRSVGILFGLLTFIIDLSKGIIPAYLSQGNLNLMLICGFSAMLGHVYPIFYNFKGGKGAGTLLGVLIIALPAGALYVTITWFLCVVLSGYVGLSTMIAVFVLLIYSVIYTSYPFIIFSACSCLFIIYTHRSNIQRMKEGNENQFSKVMLFRRNKKGSV